MATVTLSSLGSSGAPAPASSILVSGSQASATATVTVAIPAGTYQAVSDYPMAITINSVVFYVDGTANPTKITTTASATSCIITNLSMTLFTAKTIPVNLSAIAFGAGLFVALTSASTATCYTSPDGITWTVRSMPSSSAWNAVAWNGSIFAAISITSGTIAASSPDGITWTARTLSASVTWCYLAVLGSTFVAIPNTAASTVASSSTDGITWTARTLPASSQWTGITVFNSLFYAYSNTANSGTSADGITWTVRTSPISASASGVCIGLGNTIVVFGSLPTYYTSTDAITWVTRNLSNVAPSPATYSTGAINVNGCLILNLNFTAGTAPTPSGILFSIDAINWGVRYIPTTYSTATSQNLFANSSTVGVFMNLSATQTWVSGLLANPFGIYAPPTTTY